MVLRAYLKMVRSLSKSIFGKFRYRKSFIWWEISLTLIFTTFFVYLHLGCPEMNLGHPIFRYVQNFVKITFGLISHQNKDFLYLNFTHIHFESDLTTLRRPLRTTFSSLFHNIYIFYNHQIQCKIKGSISAQWKSKTS